MTKSTLTWAILSVLYLLFFCWYTSFGGPLSQVEIEKYMAIARETGPSDDPQQEKRLREFLESDTGDDFVMWNNIDMHDTPLQLEGVEPGETSEEVLGKYMEYMYPALLSRACHPVIGGDAASQALEMFGVDGLRQWTMGAGMRYRSRRDMLEIATNPAFRGSHTFKIAALDKTFAFPIDPWFQLGDPRFVLALIFLVIGFAGSWIGARGSADP